MKKKLYNVPQIEVMMLQGLNLMDTDTTSIVLPPDMAPSRDLKLF